MKLLEANPNVQHVSETNISYTADFRLAAVRANHEGQTPVEIFVNAGFDLDIIGHKKPKHCLKRWRDRYTTYGEKGLLEERRGKGSTGRRPAGSLSTEEELKRAQAKIKVLEAEVDFLKKLDALERQKKLTCSERYELLYHTIRLYDLKGLTGYLCKLAEVSRSSYYQWLSAEEKRQ